VFRLYCVKFRGCVILLGEIVVGERILV
jgi:hypothetical protein